MHPVMSAVSVVCALIAAWLLVWFLVKRPVLDGPNKLILLFAFGVFPIGSALTGNVAGFEHTKHRTFCGSCHVMVPYRRDAENPLSRSLASLHAHNEEFGADNCYECHKDYGAFSTVMTKMGGMRHVYEYYTHYYKMDTKTALETIELYKPFPNAHCIRCHSTEAHTWLEIADHRGNLALLRNGKVSCVSDGCHGPVHPFSKPKKHANTDANTHAEAAP